jgi:Predicted membrane protein (DUF2142)
MSSVRTSLRRVPLPSVGRISSPHIALRRVPLPLALLVAVAGVLSLCWTFATAPLQGPDENEHIAYIEYFAETGKLPSGTNGSFPSDENAAGAAGFAKMYQNAFARPPFQKQAERSFSEYERKAPYDPGNGPESAAKNPPLYYLLMAVPWKLWPGHAFFTHIHVIRAMGALLLMAMVALSWLMAGELFGGRRLPQAVTAAVVALQPMTGFMSGIVNTDILLCVIWAAFLWLALRTIRLGLTPARAATLALLGVLSVMTHGRGLPLLPPLGIALVVAWALHHRTLRATALAAASSLGVLLAGFVVFRFATTRSGAGGGSLYGGEVNLGQPGTFNLRQFLSSIWQFYLPKLDAMAPRLGPSFGYRQMYVQQYFAGVFASFEVYFPYWVYDLVQVSVGVLLVLGWTVGAARWRSLLAHWPKLLVLGSTALSLIFFLHLASYRSLANHTGNPLLVGRYLVPLTPVFAAGIAALVAGLPRRLGAAVAVFVLVGLLGLSLGGLGLTMVRFYA